MKITRYQLIDYKNIIFDYDSTIAVIPINWRNARKEIYVNLKNLVPEIVLPKNLRVDQMEAIALRDYEVDPFIVFATRMKYESAVIGKHEPIQQTCELIHHLRNQGKKLYILSNNLNKTVTEGLSQLDLLGMFEMVIGVDDTGFPKPDTTGFKMLEERFGALARDCAFVGDNDRTDGGFCRAVDIPFFDVSQPS
jgi:FMN phosphatase YigB (HAD superfamily)